MPDEHYLWLSAFIEHPKFNLDTRTATNSYLTKVYNNRQKVFSVCKRFYHPTAKAVGFLFFVGESSRNQGIGSELLQFVLDRASKLPVRLAVAKGNTGAQRLYSKNGFVIDGENADQYRMVNDNC